MKVIIDRFEGNFAVVELEDRTMVNMPVELIPEGSKEGSVITIEADFDETESKKNQIKKLMDDVWK